MIDATTTEVADYLVGGVFACSDDRFGAVARTKLPYVGSVGALDMVNFGAQDTVPAKFNGRTLHVHNAQVTLMRTTPEENRGGPVDRRAAEPLRRRGPVPSAPGGVSAIDAPGQPFHDPEADAALFDAIRTTLKPTDKRVLIELPHHINDPAFAAALAESFRGIVR